MQLIELSGLGKILGSALVLCAFAAPVRAATYTVNSSMDALGGTPSNCAAGNINTCTLRDAIAAATSGSDTIVFNASTTILLTGGTLPLNVDVTIDGVGHDVVVDANHSCSVFTVGGGTTTLANLTIQNGFGPTRGGGIDNSGTLALNNVTLLTNGAGQSGGGIYNIGAITLTNSTLSGNSASVAGGGIFNLNALTLINSTLAGNSAVGSGNGGAIDNAGALVLINSTLSGNSAGGSGGGVFQQSGATITNSIITDGCYVFGGSINDGGGNLDAGTSCGFSGASSNISPAAINLGPLQDNGGPTHTMAPGADSVAINAIACTNAPVTDQRALVRPDPASATLATPCDIGAVEVNSIPDAIFANGFE